MPVGHVEELLILAKTYPNPSSKHREITCVAAINKQRKLRRLFPVPFRFLQGSQRFSKWEWITARISKAPKDHRAESFTIDTDSIVRREKISTAHGWQERMQWIEDHHHPTPLILEHRRQEFGTTLGFVRPTRLLELEISKSDKPQWTEEEKEKLIQENLFDSQDVQNQALLRKVPYDFHYRYECEGPCGLETFKHKITDWEAGALYWTCHRSHGNRWETPFRQLLEVEFASKKDLLFLLGTIHRFPDQWLIVSLYYPPKQKINAPQQLALKM